MPALHLGHAQAREGGGMSEIPKGPTLRVATMLRIDPEFHAYIPALSDEERAQLEQNLMAEGCRDPLVVWGDVLIDGHNRYEICTRLGLSFATVEKDFPDREAALDWMERNQLGRRNLSPDQRRLLLGRRYNRLKRSREDNLLQNSPKDQSDTSGESTAEKLAHEHGVSEATVKRAGKFAEEVEARPELKAAVAAGKPVAQVKREAAASEPPAPLSSEDEAVAKVRREIAKLSQDGMINEIIGLREDLADAKRQVAKLKAERDDLKSKLAEALQGDLGRALGNAQRRADQLSGRMNEYMQTAKRLEYRLKKAEARVKELEDTPIAMDAA